MVFQSDLDFRVYVFFPEVSHLTVAIMLFVVYGAEFSPTHLLVVVSIILNK